MKLFNSNKELNEFISNTAKDILKNQIANKVKNLVIDYTNKNLYDKYEPHEYIRTYEFLNSITVGEINKISESKYEIEIFFDTDKIHLHIVPNNRWNQHADIHEKDVSKYIPMWIEYGTERGLYPREGAEIIPSVLEELARTNAHINIIKNMLKQNGFIVK